MFKTPEEEFKAKQSHLRILMDLTEIDGKFHLNESLFIKNVAQKLGLTEEETNFVKENPGEINYHIPGDERERMMILYHLLFLMKMDSRVSEEEILLCRKVGLKFGFNPVLVTELIELIKENVGKAIPDGEMLERVKKYMN